MFKYTECCHRFFIYIFSKFFDPLEQYVLASGCCVTFFNITRLSGDNNKEQNLSVQKKDQINKTRDDGRDFRLAQNKRWYSCCPSLFVSGRWEGYPVTSAHHSYVYIAWGAWHCPYSDFFTTHPSQNQIDFEVYKLELAKKL